MQIQTTLRPYPGAMLNPKVEKLTTVEKWAKFFLYADCSDKKDYVDRLARTEEGIMHAQEALDSISQSEAEWIRERNYWDAVATERTIREEAEIRGLESGMQRGMEQGLQRGIQQKAEETAKNLLKMNVLNNEQIAQATGLTIAEVQILADEMNV